MGPHHYVSYYKVKIYDTAVVRVSVNNFSRPNVLPAGQPCSLLPEKERFTGYLSLIIALEKAKAGALAYIEQLHKSGKYQEIVNYRKAHYEDLNINLVDSNIRKIEQELLSEATQQPE